MDYAPTIAAATGHADTSGPRSADQVFALLAPMYQDALRTARGLAAGHADADDIMQDAVVTAIEQFPALRDPQKFRAWFFQILRSRHRDRFRKSVWRRAVPMEDMTPGDEPIGEDGMASAAQRLQAQQLRAALATLNESYRQAVELADGDDMSIEEIAAVQGASPATVKSRLARGRAQLRAYFQGTDAAQTMAAGAADAAAQAASAKPRKSHRIALLVAAVLLALVAGCWAIARFVLRVDFTLPAPAIERGVTRQLEAAGVAAPAVEAISKPDISMVSMFGGGEALPDFESAIVPPKGRQPFDVRIHLKPGFELRPEDIPTMQRGLRELDGTNLRRQRGQSDAEFGAAIAAYAATFGFAVEVSFVEQQIKVLVVGRTPTPTPEKKATPNDD